MVLISSPSGEVKFDEHFPLRADVMSEFILPGWLFSLARTKGIPSSSIGFNSFAFFSNLRIDFSIFLFFFSSRALMTAGSIFFFSLRGSASIGREVLKSSGKLIAVEMKRCGVTLRGTRNRDRLENMFLTAAILKCHLPM